jgi:arylsulfatase A-like enzyme
MSDRPNILIFFTDQQRWDCSGLHGNPLDLMPNFDRLATRGTHVSNCFTCQPVCGPARACIQTGQYATTNGTWHNGIPLTREVPALAELFNDAGYDTGYIGKWHLSQKRQGAVSEEERGGYRYWLASNVLEFTSNAYETVMWDGDDNEVSLPGYRVDALTQAFSHLKLKQKRYRGRDLPETRAPMEEDHDEE